MQVIATAGHVDHGKSTLVRALTGMEPDRWAQERQRGMTIDLGFAWTVLPSGATVAFVDVPGHERFVGNMLAGVGPVPAALIAVAADEGWMPQSAEHLDALEALGVRDGLLVITRSDVMEPELARDEALAHLADSALGPLPAVCVSAVTGAGMDALRGALDELVARLPAADPTADVRFWIDRAFTIRGAGTVVTGTLTAGRIRVDDELELAGRRRVTVRGLQSLGEPVPDAAGVARVALNLRGLPREQVARGDVLLTPGAWLRGDLVDVRLHGVRGRAPDAGALPAELTLHIGSAAVPARVRPLGPDLARLRLAGALPLRIGDRALLRDPGQRRVAAGLTVLDVRPPALRRRGDTTRRAAELAAMSGVPDAFAELARRGVVPTAELAAMGVDIAPLREAGTPAAGGCSTPAAWPSWPAGSPGPSPSTTPPTRSIPACRSRPRAGRWACPMPGWSTPSCANRRPSPVRQERHWNCATGASCTPRPRRCRPRSAPRWRSCAPTWNAIRSPRRRPNGSTSWGSGPGSSRAWCGPVS
jgi:selenocysteine-specific elongation factor